MGGRETQPPLGAKRRGKRSSERPGGGGRRPGAKGAVSHRAPPAPGPPRRRAGPPAGTGPPPPPAAAASSHGVRIRAGPRRAAGVGAGATGEDNKDILHIHSCWAGGARRGAGGRPGRARGGAWRGQRWRRAQCRWAAGPERTPAAGHPRGAPRIGSRRWLGLGDAASRGTHPGVAPCPRPCGGSSWGRAPGSRPGPLSRALLVPGAAA